MQFSWWAMVITFFSYSSSSSSSGSIETLSPSSLRPTSSSTLRAHTLKHRPQPMHFSSLMAPTNFGVHNSPLGRVTVKEAMANRLQCSTARGGKFLARGDQRGMCVVRLFGKRRNFLPAGGQVLGQIVQIHLQRGRLLIEFFHLRFQGIEVLHVLS